MMNNGGSPYGGGSTQGQGGTRYTPGGSARYGQGAGAGGYGMYQPQQSPGGMYGNSNLTPMGNIGNSQVGGGGRLSPNGGNSPRTPVPQYRGRLSPASQMMSPSSDPFNPVCFFSLFPLFNVGSLTRKEDREEREKKDQRRKSKI